MAISLVVNLISCLSCAVCFHPFASLIGPTKSIEQFNVNPHALSTSARWTADNSFWCHIMWLSMLGNGTLFMWPHLDYSAFSPLLSLPFFLRRCGLDFWKQKKHRNETIKKIIHGRRQVLKVGAQIRRRRWFMRSRWGCGWKQPKVY